MNEPTAKTAAEPTHRLARFLNTFGPLLALAFVWLGFGLLESQLQGTPFLRSAIFTSEAVSQIVQQSVVIGIAAQTFTTSVNSSVQLSTAPAMRGRVMAIVLAISAGGTPLGAPIVGWVADTFGPRWALGVGAASGIASAIVGLLYRRRARAARR